MENNPDHKLELIYKKAWYKNKRATKPCGVMYYLNKEDFDFLIEGDRYELNDRTMRIELIVISNKSHQYITACRNSERLKKLRELRKDIEDYFGEPIPLIDLRLKYFIMNCEKN